MIILKEYLGEDGSSPFAKWFEKLPADAAARVTRAIVKLSLGHVGNVKSLGDIKEYKIDHGPGYRIYFGMDGLMLIILLGGGDKTTQSADIAEAKHLWGRYRRSKAEGQTRGEMPSPTPGSTKRPERKH